MHYEDHANFMAQHKRLALLVLCIGCVYVCVLPCSNLAKESSGGILYQRSQNRCQRDTGIWCTCFRSNEKSMLTEFALGGGFKRLKCDSQMVKSI